MIVSGYSADFYCDGCNNEIWRYGALIQLTGETWGECVRQAREYGWRVSHDRNVCLCPKCVKAGKRLIDIQKEDLEQHA